MQQPAHTHTQLKPDKPSMALKERGKEVVGKRQKLLLTEQSAHPEE